MGALRPAHQRLGLRYFTAGVAFLFLGGLLAMLMRWQLGFPHHALPGMQRLAPSGMPGGRMLPDYYHMLFTMHATIMIFFAIIPTLMGGFANYLVPLLIGAQDTALPRLGRFAFFLYLLSGAVLLSSFVLGTGAARAGWFAYPPLSTFEPMGQTIWILSLLILGVSWMLNSANLLATILAQRAPGMFLLRLPLTVWAVFVTGALLLLSLPALVVALVCLLLDRTAGTSFFLPAGLLLNGHALLARGGGQPLLWQHLFWFFGHPVVYVVIMPAMGIVSDVVAVFSRRPLFGYRGMVAALCGIGALGFFVWGHHMFVSGMNPYLGSTFMLSTVVIAVPSGIKTFNWLGTLWRGSLRFSSAMLCALAFVAVFVIGGLAGIFTALTPLDTYLHNTSFVLGHFHFMMAGGAIFGVLAGTYYWFPHVTGRRLNEVWGRIHVVSTFVLFNCIFYPMFVLGVAGEPRRMFEFSVYPELAALQPLRVFMSLCAFLMFTVQGLFLFNLVKSRFKGAEAGDNPWDANTLEWGARQPALRVYRGPYEYSHPSRSTDSYPQTEPS